MEHTEANACMTIKDFESNLKQVHTDKYIETAQNVRLYSCAHTMIWKMDMNKSRNRNTYRW